MGVLSGLLSGVPWQAISMKDFSGISSDLAFVFSLNGCLIGAATFGSVGLSGLGTGLSALFFVPNTGPQPPMLEYTISPEEFEELPR